MKNFLPLFLAPALLAAPSLAQHAASAQRIDAPVQYLGTYRFADASWSTTSRAGSRVLYNCTTPGNYYSTIALSGGSGAADQLWIDEGRITDHNALAIDQINGFDFSYCSTDLDPTGNSSALRIAFYDDYVPCTTPPAPTCDYLIAGLPLSSTGNLQCWSVAVDLSGGYECSTDATLFRTTDAGGADRSFGWAFGGNPSTAGRTNTGPILDLPCATPVASQGCGSGNQNLYWWEDPSGAFTGCYWFGGVPWASFSMQAYGGSRNSFAYGYSFNDLVLESTDLDPGAAVTFTVKDHDPAFPLFLLASPAIGSLLFDVGDLVVSTAFYPGIPFPMNPVTGSLTVNIPAGVPSLYVQAAQTYGPATASALRNLSNGISNQSGGGRAKASKVVWMIGQENAGAPCGPGEVRLKGTAIRYRGGEGGKVLTVKAITPSGTQTWSSPPVQDCGGENTSTLHVYFDGCFASPPPPKFLLEWTDCDGATGSIEMPLGAATIQGCLATTTVGKTGIASADSLGTGWKHCKWSSSDKNVVEVDFQTGEWTAKGPGTAWIVLTCTRKLPAEGRTEQVTRRFQVTVT